MSEEVEFRKEKSGIVSDKLNRQEDGELAEITKINQQRSTNIILKWKEQEYLWLMIFEVNKKENKQYDAVDESKNSFTNIGNKRIWNEKLYIEGDDKKRGADGSGTIHFSSETGETIWIQ